MNIEKFYQRYYTDPAQEASKLFEVLQENYLFQRVLYPESFIHITPSFYFPDVHYVEDDETASCFFTEKEKLDQFIKNKKTYPQTPSVHFWGVHFKNPLPLEKNSFDLLISFYTKDIREFCKPYLKPGGMLLINYQADEVISALADAEFKLFAVIEDQGGYHEIKTKSLFRYKEKKRLTRKEKLEKAKQHLSHPMDYYLFQKL